MKLIGSYTHPFVPKVAIILNFRCILSGGASIAVCWSNWLKKCFHATVLRIPFHQ